MTKLKLKENGITVALPTDAPQIAAMCIQSMKEGGVPLTPCFEKICSIVDQVVTNELCFVRRNRVNPKMVDGLLLLSHRTPDYTLDEIIYGLMFYIKPQYRGFSLARNLLNSAQKYAIIVDTPLVFDLFTQRDVNKKKKLLTYLGFKEVGSLYFFQPPAKSNEGNEGTCLVESAQ